jgi:hypothetical protein
MTEEILGDIGAKLENALRKSLEKLAQQAWRFCVFGKNH